MKHFPNQKPCGVKRKKERMIIRFCVLAPSEGLESDELQASIAE
jgi:hypothetical protein